MATLNPMVPPVSTQFLDFVSVCGWNALIISIHESYGCVHFRDGTVRYFIFFKVAVEILENLQIVL